jgi:hypothetical protein
VHLLFDGDRLGGRSGPESGFVTVDGLRGQERHGLGISVQVEAVLRDVIDEGLRIEAAVSELGEERQSFDLLDDGADAVPQLSGQWAGGKGDGHGNSLVLV